MYRAQLNPAALALLLVFCAAGCSHGTRSPGQDSGREPAGKLWNKCEFVLRAALFGKKADARNYRWLGDRYPSPQTWKFSLMMGRLKSVPPKGSYFVLVDYPILINLHTIFKLKSPMVEERDGRTYFRAKENGASDVYHWQEFTKNGEYEQGLLEKSTLDETPHEVGQVRLKTSGGIMAGDLIDGNLRSVELDAETLYGQIGALIEKARTLGLEIHEIEFNHTHPPADFALVGKQELILEVSSLSNGDLFAAREISTRFPDIRFRMRATTPGDITFELTFLGGAKE